MYLFDESWGYSWKSSATETGIKLEVVLPGYGKEDLSVRLDSRKRLHITTKDGQFDKTFKVLSPIGTINSTMVNGILKVEIQSDEPADSETEIEIV